MGSTQTTVLSSACTSTDSSLGGHGIPPSTSTMYLRWHASSSSYLGAVAGPGLKLLIPKQHNTTRSQVIYPNYLSPRQCPSSPHLHSSPTHHSLLFPTPLPNALRKPTAPPPRPRYVNVSMTQVRGSRNHHLCSHRPFIPCQYPIRRCLPFPFLPLNSHPHRLSVHCCYRAT